MTGAGDSTEELPTETGEVAAENSGLATTEQPIDPNRHDRFERRLHRLLVIPYLIGIVWTLLHPVLSIVTGELKCRGWYIDENALGNSGGFQVGPRYKSAPAQRRGIVSICDAIDVVIGMKHKGGTGGTGNVECLRHDSIVEIAKIVPESGAIVPTSETIVIVLPPSADWYTSDFHFAVLQLMKRLADPVQSPWLAKTILVVSSVAVPVETLVPHFLDVYMGDKDPEANTPLKSASNSTTATIMLPTAYNVGIIRNLIVLDAENKMVPPRSARNDILILPQGQLGQLPNMDMVFLIMVAYARATFMDGRHVPANMLMHPYLEESLTWKQWVHELRLDPFYTGWLSELMDLALFMLTLAVGPAPPHAAALDRGIDSVTIKATLASTRRTSLDHTTDFVLPMEQIVRALSNLHERLHHSITQYLMPSPQKFVSHAEYLIPNFLLLIPVVIKALMLILRRILRFSLVALNHTVLICVVSFALYILSRRADETVMNGLLTAVYCALLYSLIKQQRIRRSKGNSRNEEDLGDSLQFMTCLLVIYTHVPMVLGHVSVAFPSSLLWSAVVALIPLQSTNVLQRIVICLVLAASWPPVLAVPRLFGMYSEYVTMLWIPLHLMVTTSWASRFQ